MKDELLKYKDYYASIHYSKEDMCFFGKVEFIDGLITFEADKASELESAFHEAVEEYIQDCKELNVEPQKTFSGQLPLRLGKELHKEVAIAAKNINESINKFCIKAIEEKLKLSFG